MIAFGVRANSNLSIFSCVCQQQHEFNASAAPCIRTDRKNKIRFGKMRPSIHIRETHTKFVVASDKKISTPNGWTQWCIPQVNHKSTLFLFFFRIFRLFTIYSRIVIAIVSVSAKIKHSTLHIKCDRNIKDRLKMKLRAVNAQWFCLFYTLNSCFAACRSLTCIFNSEKEYKWSCFFFNPRSTTKTWKLSMGFSRVQIK